MTTKLLYFPGVSNEEAREAFLRLEAIAKSLGFVTTSGPDTGKGNWRKMLLAIARGELQIVKE